MTEAIVHLSGITKRLEASDDGRLDKRIPPDLRREMMQAVTSIDLSLAEGEVVALVGEPGCGKSTVAAIIAGRVKPTVGIIRYRGVTEERMTRPQRRAWKLAVQLLHEESPAMLNRYRRVAHAIGAVSVTRGLIARRDAELYVAHLMRLVGLDPAGARLKRRHFSADHLQRICIARALAVRPSVLVCDEPLAALSAATRPQILDLLMELCRSQTIACLYATRSLAMMEHVSDRIAIMYLGRIVEVAPNAALFATPNHPYTQALVGEVRVLEGPLPADRPERPGDAVHPSRLDLPPGCAFQFHCPYTGSRCRIERPRLREVAPGRFSACHLNDP